MNIWIVANGIAPEQVGGSETQTLGLATELAKPVSFLDPENLTHGA